MHADHVLVNVSFCTEHFWETVRHRRQIKPRTTVVVRDDFVTVTVGIHHNRFADHFGYLLPILIDGLGRLLDGDTTSVAQVDLLFVSVAVRVSQHSVF